MQGIKSFTMALTVGYNIYRVNNKCIIIIIFFFIAMFFLLMKGRMVKTRLNEIVYNRVSEYAEKNGISIYEALRRLIEKGLDHEDRIYKLLNDDDFIISILTVRIKYDPTFIQKIGKLLSTPEEL
ncbi:MAG: hypothetical protein J7K23_07990 [Thermoproteales archaeon]|nr:hypothetical protein [Thermoproteales archaeon]